jgi:hypothetical protein
LFRDGVEAELPTIIQVSGSAAARALSARRRA